MWTYWSPIILFILTLRGEHFIVNSLACKSVRPVATVGGLPSEDWRSFWAYSYRETIILSTCLEISWVICQKWSRPMWWNCLTLTCVSSQIHHHVPTWLSMTGAALKSGREILQYFVIVCKILFHIKSSIQQSLKQRLTCQIIQLTSWGHSVSYIKFLINLYA